MRTNGLRVRWSADGERGEVCVRVEFERQERFDIDKLQLQHAESRLRLPSPMHKMIIQSTALLACVKIAVYRCTTRGTE